jgi:hypothetical protein
MATRLNTDEASQLLRTEGGVRVSEHRRPEPRPCSIIAGLARTGIAHAEGTLL